MDLEKIAKVDLIKELGIDKLPEEKREHVLMQMGEIIQQRTLLRLAEEMADEQKDEFNKVLDENKEDPEKVTEYLQTNFPELDKIVMEEIGRYKQEIMDLMKGVKGAKGEK
jgi:ribosomal protein S17E